VATYVLPLLLLVVVAVVGVATRRGGEPDTRPLALPPVDAPDAAGPACARMLASVSGDLPADSRTLPRLALAAPAPPGAAAWAGAPGGQPVVLRCGLPRPAELTPTSALIVINGVSWLELSDPDRDTFIAVDRPVYLALTVPHGLGTGPVQAVSDAARTALPPR
jgi:hypothetical protein